MSRKEESPIAFVLGAVIVASYWLVQQAWFWVVLGLVGAWGIVAYFSKADAHEQPATAEMDEVEMAFSNCHRFMSLGQWDLARRSLQKIAYSIVSRSPAEKQEFTELMKEFAARDPLVSGVLRKAMPLIRAEPGILQTAVYKYIPGVGIEEIRYAFYFAEQLGILRREKKGSSYRLFSATDIINTD
jgi:hypothetical protein